MSYILLYVYGMWMYGHVWAKINLICLPLLLTILFLKVSHWTMAFQFSKTEFAQNPEILVCLSKPWDYRCTPPYSASYMGATDPHSSPVQALYEPTYLPSIYVLPFRTLTIASYSVLLHPGILCQSSTDGYLFFSAIYLFFFYKHSCELTL